MLALQFGFQPNINISEHYRISKQRYLDIWYPLQVFVYTNITQAQFLGYTKATILRNFRNDW